VDYLRSYIHYLRKKLEPDPGNPKYILSNPGIGYMLAVPENETSTSQKDGQSEF
jgi:DNA-binding response OmpR family regulator